MNCVMGFKVCEGLDRMKRIWWKTLNLVETANGCSRLDDIVVQG